MKVLTRDLIKNLINKKMIDKPRQFALADFSNKQPMVVFSVNWNDFVKGCEYIEIRIGDKKAVVRRQHLNSLMFMMGSTEDQRKLIPVKHQTTTMYETDLEIQATKDIKKDEKINVHVNIPLPREEVEGLGLKTN